MNAFTDFHSGDGVGLSSTSGCSGGGHGGAGGQGEGQPKAGQGHGSWLHPTSFGYNGGHSIFPHTAGIGAGRVAIETDHLTVDGFLTARGGPWRSAQSGGGSGGSVYVETTELDGDGVLDVSGGDGYGGTAVPHGGGGGAGRIAVYYVINNYVGKSNCLVILQNSSRAYTIIAVLFMHFSLLKIFDIFGNGSK